MSASLTWKLLAIMSGILFIIFTIVLWDAPGLRDVLEVIALLTPVTMFIAGYLRRQEQEEAKARGEKPDAKVQDTSDATAPIISDPEFEPGKND